MEHGRLVIALVATLAVQALTSLTVFTAAILAPSAQADVGAAASGIGVFTALVYACASFSAPLGATYVTRLGAVRVSQICLVLAGIGLAACGLAHIALIIAGALVIGMGYGPVTPASSTLLIERTPDRLRNFIMSIRQTGVPVGGAFAGVVVPWLAIVAGWRAAAVAIAGLCLALALVLQRIRAEFDRPFRGATGRRPSLSSLVRMVLAHPELRRVSLASFAYAGIQVCFTSYLVVFLTENAGYSVVNAGAVLSASMVAGIAGRVLWGAAADYWRSARGILAALGLIMTLCAWLIAFVTASWPLSAVFLLCIVFGATAVGWNGVFIAEVARVAPEGRVAVATGASLAFTYLGVVVGPFFFWLIVTATASYAIAFVSSGLVALAAAGSLAHPVRRATRAP